MRKACYIQTAIWADPPFIRLSTDCKLSYLMLLSQPDVATTGCLPLTLGRWAMKTGFDRVTLVDCLGGLALAGFTWDDPDTEELVIRSWVKHNVAGNPKMEKAARDQFPHIQSWRLRGHLAVEYPLMFSDLDTLSDRVSIPYPADDSGVQDRVSGVDPLARVACSVESGQQDDLSRKAVTEQGATETAIEEKDEGRARALAQLLDVATDADKHTARTYANLVEKYGLREADVQRAREATLAARTSTPARYAAGALKRIGEERAA